MTLTYIAQGSEPVGDGGDQYTGLDRFGRVIDQRWVNGSGAALDRIQYGFDRASNRLYRANVVAEAASANQDEYYTYDTLNQLLTLQRGTLNNSRTDITGTPAAEEDFTFDPTGNWEEYQTKASGSVTLDQSRTHNPANEITGIDSSSATIGQDAAGNVTKAPKPTSWGAANTLVYDAWNRLVQVKDGSTTVATYAYDGLNRRTTKATGSTRHYYYTPSWQIVEERLNSATTADRQNVWGLMGLDNLILRDRSTERFYMAGDVFNGIAIINTSGSVQERYGYAAFGQLRFMDANFTIRTSSNYDWETLFGNYRHDSESGYYQVRYRYLHPTLGRWLSRDPLRYADGKNLYAYVRNNTTNRFDYFGLVSHEECQRAISTAKSSNKKTKDLLSGLTALKCPDPDPTCCKCGDKPEGGHFDPDTKKITVCEDKYTDADAIVEALVHELVHACDYCQNNDCFGDCACRACSEIKAADYSGQCASGGKWRLPSETYRDCVSRVATQSTTQGGCKAEDVTSQLSKCIGSTPCKK